VAVRCIGNSGSALAAGQGKYDVSRTL